MKLRSVLACTLAAFGTLFGGGIAKAQPNQYQVLQNLYGSEVAGSSATAAFWNKYLISGSNFSAIGSTVSLKADVAFSAGQDMVLGTTTPGGSNAQMFGALTGKTVLGAGNVYDSSSASVYKFVGTGSNAFFSSTGQGGTTPPIGTISFHPANNPFAWTVSSLQTAGTIQDGESISDYNAANHTNYATWAAAVAAQTASTATSMNSADMVAYQLDLNGQINYVLMWNLEGQGNLGNGNYTDLVLDVTGVKNPEPTSLALMGFGALGLLGYKVRRRNKPSQTPVV
jgi:hypothetical protein